MAELSKNTSVTRRIFLKQSVLIAVTLSIPVMMACRKKDDEPIPINEGDCLTTDDILGPFYKAGSPFREDIVPSSSQGEPLLVEGTVFTDCDTPVKDAIVEIWNADEDGAYDTSNDFRFRGSFRTKQDGAYRFRTIIPGRYLNGGTFRPSHIHFRITAPGHEELVSQIYFKDDPFIKDDPWAGSLKAVERILTVTHDASGTDTVNFNIYLNRA